MCSQPREVRAYLRRGALRDVRRNRAQMVIALAVVAGLGTLVLFAWDRVGDGQSNPTAEDAPAIEARADFAPRKVLFGDTVRALVDVTLDRDRVDPDSVRIKTDFAPWKRLGNPERLRRDDGTTTSIRMTYALRCLSSSCVSRDVTAVQNDTTTKVFTQVRVTYTGREGTGALRAPWPLLTIGARYSPTAAQAATPWQADLLSLPAVTYTMTPGLLFVLLLAAGALLAIAGGAFAYRALRRRTPPPALTRADEPSWPVLTPLELALALLEDSARVNGAGDQRRALELVAAALVEHGDMNLAEAARALAWSKPVPEIGETNGLAVQARSALGEGLHAHLE